METIDLEELLAHCQDVAQALKERDPDALRQLRGLIGDLDLSDVVEQPGGLRVVGPLYLVQRIINDVYSNLATDASFGFPTESDNWALMLLLDLSAELGLFIMLTLPSDKATPEYGDALASLLSAISKYFSLISEINARTHSVDSIDKLLFSKIRNKGAD